MSDLFLNIPLPQSMQRRPIVVNSSIAAQNDRVYHVVANATFTDPTPVEGRGYVVFLRNGTVTIGGSPFTNNSIYYRIFHSGSWLTYRYDNINSLIDTFVRKSDYTPAHSLLVQQSATGSPTSVPIGTNEILGRLSGGGGNIKGLTKSEVKVLLDLENTNTGDETQSSILSKLGWWKVLDTTASPILTGVATETIMKALELPALSNGSKFKINDLRVTKSGIASCTIRAYINNVNNNLAGAVQILSTGSAFAASGLIATVERTFKIQSGNIRGFSSATGVFTDKSQSTAIPLNAALPTDTLYLIVTLTQAVGESSQVELIDISNF